MKQTDEERGAAAGGGPEIPHVPGAIRRAIRQSRPFRAPSQEALIGILVAAERLRRNVTLVVEPYGVSYQQYNVLRILRGAQPDPLATLEIGSRMIETTPGVTRLLDRLEEKGWVERKRCTEDRRQVHCRITPAGLDLLAELDPLVERLDERIGEVLPPDQMQTLLTLLNEVIEACDARAFTESSEDGTA